jgi:hypothetical protein
MQIGAGSRDSISALHMPAVSLAMLTAAAASAVQTSFAGSEDV